ncbi:MAG: adaptor protein MecA [Lachnospiraceae bacterium]|nr:adaptor protein MecA [Lachnospiraceae bacterium]
MKFKRIDVETVRCLVSEEELQENGLNMDDFLSNGEKTEGFLRKIVSMAQEEVGYKVPGGSLSVQASILPNRVLSLTFSEKQGQGIMDILKNLKNAVSKLSEAMQEAEKKAAEPDQAALAGIAKKNSYQIEFSKLDYLMRYASAIYLAVPVENLIYHLDRNDRYYLVILKGRMSEDQICRILSASLDFCEAIYSDEALLAYLDEHGEKILERSALQILQNI